jgi:hypothetical protein
VEIGATPGSAQRPEHQKPALPNSELRRHNQLLQIDESEQGDETRQSDQFVLSEFTWNGDVAPGSGDFRWWSLR